MQVKEFIKVSIYIDIYDYQIGVRTTDNKYTSPVLEIHTWYKSATQINVNQADMTVRVALGGLQTARDNADRHIGPLRGAEQRRIELEEKTTVIPVESILSIKSSNEIKKGETEYRNVRLRTPPPPIKLSCCQRINRWCSRTFCCCCNNAIGQGRIEPEEIITTISNQEAERKILITIEYSRYSNIDTPSHIRVLSLSDQVAFFRERFHTDILEFYLLDNHDFEQTDFDLKRMQASTICRLVTQLKSMSGHYPDALTLEHIIGKHDTLAIGNPPEENFRRLTSAERINASLNFTTVPIEAVENDRF